MLWRRIRTATRGVKVVSTGLPTRRQARFVVLSDTLAPTTAQDFVGSNLRLTWRVIAANNRALGRSPGTFSDFEECIQAAHVLHVRAAELNPTTAFDRATLTWRWAVLLDGRPVAECARVYRRRIECARALNQFTSIVEAAAPEIDEVRYAGPWSAIR
jgi:hypothetical protein